MSQSGLIAITNSILPPDVPLIFEGNSGSGSALNHIFEILGAGSISTSVSGNILTITQSEVGFTWNIVTSATNPNQIAASNGYICAGVSMVTFTLPLAPNVGDTFKVLGFSSLFRITPNANQVIVVGATSGHAGPTGTLTSNFTGDFITLTYVGSNTFVSEAPQGTLALQQ